MTNILEAATFGCGEAPVLVTFLGFVEVDYIADGFRLPEDFARPGS